MPNTETRETNGETTEGKKNDRREPRTIGGRRTITTMAEAGTINSAAMRSARKSGARGTHPSRRRH